MDGLTKEKSLKNLKEIEDKYDALGINIKIYDRPNGGYSLPNGTLAGPMSLEILNAVAKSKIRLEDI